MEIQNLEDFKTPYNVIEYPHFYRKGSMDMQWDYLTEQDEQVGFCQKLFGGKSDIDTEGGCLKEELLDIPLINFLDPNSIRSVGAFYRCVFNFGYNKRQCFQTLYAWAIISVLMGIVLTWLKTSTTKDSGMQNWIIMYSIVVISPCHVLPVFFWIFFYNYYGAYVNQSFMDISELYNEMGNVLDSIRTMLIMESTFGGLKVHIFGCFFSVLLILESKNGGDGVRLYR